MITLSVLDVKKKKIKEEVFISKDKAEERLNDIAANPKKWSLKGASYDTSSEERIIHPFLFPKRKEDTEDD